MFEHAIGLADLGYNITLVVPSMADLRRQNWHRIFFERHPLICWEEITTAGRTLFDIAIATFWRTLLELGKLRANKYIYFVQSIESRFYPETDEVVRAIVEATYELDIGYITEARWIKSYLEGVRGREVELARNGVRKSLFNADGAKISERPSGKLRVLIEGPIDADFKNVPDTIAICREIAGCELWLLTSSDLDSYDRVDRVFSKLPIDEVGSVYRSCDVLVKLSFVEGMFGPPLEMFHCGGTAIVYDVTGFDEYMTHGRNSLVAKTGDRTEVSEFLSLLVESNNLLEHLKRGAAATATNWPSWEQAVIAFEGAVQAAAMAGSCTQDNLQVVGRRLQHIMHANWRELRRAREG